MYGASCRSERWHRRVFMGSHPEFDYFGFCHRLADYLLRNRIGRCAIHLSRCQESRMGFSRHPTRMVGSSDSISARDGDFDVLGHQLLSIDSGLFRVCVNEH